ncbi:hypothetical protein [Flavobacterium sp. K5-23]|uniref:hypothetical protein n=1 Tax=Flavobacterium sp. K5-23 TaxID=2746225 RepID=UPI0020109EC1|nr:hypothetical protein [Flavobacterium sp. K5-23]UQD56387.1 hypothetical protein FLAK523_08340 [Flavobacterium sp. K5-23]
MIRILFFILMVGMSFSGYSQIESNTKFKSIPPKNTDIKPKKIIPPVPEKPAKVTPKATPKITEYPDLDKPKPAPLSMVPKDEFINPGDAVKDRLNKKEPFPEGVFYRRNQNLGSFKTSAVVSKVLYRDAAYVDGDKIRVYLNDKVIQYEVYLDSNFKGFEIVLEKGINKIDFEALNQGESGPNTAEFQVYDDKGVVISASQWNLGTGFKATIILIKE